LEIGLTDGRKIIRDFSDFVRQEATGVLAPLKDAKFFRRVRVSHGTLEWPGEIDFCPDVIIWLGPPPKRPRSPVRTASFPVV